METIYTFKERGGDRAAASADPKGANLPGGEVAWTRVGEMLAREMNAESGVTGIGNARRVLELVRANGFAIAEPGKMIGP